MRSKLSQALFGSAMALAVSSSAHARPVVFEPRDDVTFSMRVGKTALSPSVSGRSFDLSGASTPHGGYPLFGSASFGNDDAFVLGWNPNSQGNSQGKSNGHVHDHEAQGHELVVTEKTFDGTGRQEVVVPAVPEPSTYALLALGLAGITLVARRRRGHR